MTEMFRPAYTPHTRETEPRNLGCEFSPLFSTPGNNAIDDLNG